MNTYLAIITTLLVLTQFIRLMQNSKQLLKYEETRRRNDRIMEIYENLNYVADRFLDEFEKKYRG